MKRGHEVQTYRTRNPALLDNPRDSGLEGADPGSSRFIAECWQIDAFWFIPNQVVENERLLFPGLGMVCG